MDFKVVLNKVKEGGYVVSCPELPGCISQGKTRKEAITNIKEAIACYLEGMEKDNLEHQVFEKMEILSVKVEKTTSH